jgi:uncharacterized protein (TIGR03000 family)
VQESDCKLHDMAHQLPYTTCARFAHLDNSIEGAPCLVTTCLSLESRIMIQSVFHGKPVATLASLALLAPVALAGPSVGGRSHGTGYSGRSTSSYYYAPASVTPVSVTPASVTPISVPPAPAAGTSSSYYSPDSAATTAGGTAAELHIRVPANAEIWLNDYKTKLTGAHRIFVSPPLAGDQDYRYHVRVRWLENGQEITQERAVPVAPGTRTSVQFAGLAR